MKIEALRSIRNIAIAVAAAGMLIAGFASVMEAKPAHAQVPGPSNGIVNDQGGTQTIYELAVGVQTWTSTGISKFVLTKGTGTVVTNAVTINALSGVITDDTTDIAADTTRADITLTDSTIVATSVVDATICKKPTDANVGLIVAVTPGAGSAVLSVRNAGTGGLTTNNDVKICFHVSN